MLNWTPTHPATLSISPREKLDPLCGYESCELEEEIPFLKIPLERGGGKRMHEAKKDLRMGKPPGTRVKHRTLERTVQI